MANIIIRIIAKFCPACGKHHLIEKGKTGQAYCVGCGLTVVI